MKTACKRLQEVAKIDATKALAQTEIWFKEAAHDGEAVLKAIETGWGKEYPIGYISKVISNLSQSSTTSERWVIDGGKYADDPGFKVLSRDEQLAFLNFEKQQNVPKWLIKHTENYQPGTVMMFGGKNEITLCTDPANMFGIISTKPGLIMNSSIQQDVFYYPIALTGRVPVRVKGKIKKHDRITAYIDGTCKASIDQSDDCIERALEDKDTEEEGLVSCFVQAIS